MTDQTDEKQIKDDSTAVLQKILAEIGETPEFKTIKIETIQKLLSGWSGHSMFKKMVSGRMIKKIDRDLAAARASQKTNIHEMELWEDIGKLITLGSKYVVLKDGAKPAGTAEFLEEPLKQVLSHTDFNDILDMAAATQAQGLSTQNMIHDVMARFPSKMEKIPALKQIKTVTHLKKKTLSLQNIENMPAETFDGTMTNLSESIHETTETLGIYFNAWVRVINRVLYIRPELGSSALSFLLSSIDRDELKTAVNRLIPDITESLKPIARDVMPALINGLCELLKPGPAEDRDELDEALANLNNILSP
jgi:hypothetical protein